MVYFPMTVARARCHQPLRRGRGASAAASVPSFAEEAGVASPLLALAVNATSLCSSVVVMTDGAVAVSPREAAAPVDGAAE
jgi:hypothetical protein